MREKKFLDYLTDIFLLFLSSGLFIISLAGLLNSYALRMERPLWHVEMVFYSILFVVSIVIFFYASEDFS